MINIEEKGSAKIIVSLEDSIITMRHGDTKEILFKNKARRGDWNKIINSILQMKNSYLNERTYNENI